MQLRGLEDSEDGTKMLAALCLGTEKKMPTQVRMRVFGALWSMAACAANLKAMWRHIDVRYAIRDALSPEEVEDVRSNALAVLWSLAVSEANRVPIWQDEDMRRGLLAAIAPDQSSPIRVNALNALRSLGMTKQLQEPLWNNEELQFLLLQAVSIGQPQDVRTSALHCLCQLANHFRNARKMAISGVREILHQAAVDEQLEPVDHPFFKAAAERLEGAENWDDDDVLPDPYLDPAPAAPEPAADQDVPLGEAEASASAEWEAAQAESAEETAALLSVDPSAGALQTGVLNRAGERIEPGGYAG
jgi:hypothetical protein